MIKSIALVRYQEGQYVLRILFGNGSPYKILTFALEAQLQKIVAICSLIGFYYGT